MRLARNVEYAVSNVACWFGKRLRRTSYAAFAAATTLDPDAPVMVPAYGSYRFA